MEQERPVVTFLVAATGLLLYVLSFAAAVWLSLRTKGDPMTKRVGQLIAQLEALMTEQSGEPVEGLEAVLEEALELLQVPGEPPTVWFSCQACGAHVEGKWWGGAEEHPGRDFALEGDSTPLAAVAFMADRTPSCPKCGAAHRILVRSIVRYELRKRSEQEFQPGGTYLPGGERPLGPPNPER